MEGHRVVVDPVGAGNDDLNDVDGDVVVGRQDVLREVSQPAVTLVLHLRARRQGRRLVQDPEPLRKVLANEGTRGFPLMRKPYSVADLSNILRLAIEEAKAGGDRASHVGKARNRSAVP